MAVLLNDNTYYKATEPKLGLGQSRYNNRILNLFAPDDYINKTIHVLILYCSSARNYKQPYVTLQGTQTVFFDICQNFIGHENSLKNVDYDCSMETLKYGLSYLGIFMPDFILNRCNCSVCDDINMYTFKASCYRGVKIMLENAYVAFIRRALKSSVSYSTVRKEVNNILNWHFKHVQGRAITHVRVVVTQEI